MKESKLKQWSQLRRCLPVGATAVSALLFGGAALAQEALPEIEVGASVVTPANVERDTSGAPANAGDGGNIPGALVNPASTQPNPRSSVTPEGIKILGGPAQADVYQTLNLMPSVITDSADPYGLSFNRSITVRGVSDFFLSQTYNGLPIAPTAAFISSVNTLFDLEDVARIDLYRGSIQANQGLGFSNAAGVIDLRLLAPQPHFGGTVSQGFGSDGFLRTFYALSRASIPVCCQQARHFLCPAP